MKHIQTDTLIIGAGPAGLAAAMKLADAGKDFIIVEKSSQVGGLAKTYTFTEGDDVFLTDNGPHRFFSKNQELYRFIEGLLDEQWIQVKRQTRQYIGGKFYDYPIKPFQALKNIGPLGASRMLFDYGVASIRYKLLGKPVVTFADYVYANFGKSLGEFGMINYTEKIWGLPASQIHLDWAGQRIKGLSLRALLKDALKRGSTMVGKKSEGPKSLVDVFYYPEKGTGQIYETIRQKLEGQGYKIYMNTWPTKVLTEGTKIKKVICQSPEGEIEFKCKTLIESVPLKDFLTLLDPSPFKASAIRDAHKKLTYRSQVYLFITLNKSQVTADQWIYFPEKQVPIGRMSEMRNFSAAMAPAGTTSLFLEFFCSMGDDIWNMTADELFEYTLPHLEKGSFITRDEVRKYYLLKESNVYPVYDLEYKEYLGAVTGFLDQFENLLYIGRPGRFRYNNQDHSLEMGFLAAKSVIDGQRYDIGAVGEEKNYYESGAVYEKSGKTT